MKKTLIAAGLASLMSTTAMAEGIGVSMALFDDNFLTVLRNGIQAQADAAGLSVQIEDAQNDVAKQLDQINNFIASGVDAIIVNPVDTSATQAMSDAAAAAGVPLVYVNRQPINVDTLPDNQAFVASNEVESVTLRDFIEQCNQWKAAGKDRGQRLCDAGRTVEPGRRAAHAELHDVIDAGKCAVKVNVIDQQTANWSRDQAQILMTNWLSTGAAFDGVLANNDEMALGAIQAMKAAGIDMDVGHRVGRRCDPGRAGLDAGGRSGHHRVPERGGPGRRRAGRGGQAGRRAKRSSRRSTSRSNW